MSRLQPWMDPAHLAPGDTKSLEGDWSGIQLHHILDEGDGFFSRAYGALWEEFGAKGQMECAEVIARRLRWNPTPFSSEAVLRYAMLLLTHRGKFVAVRDHTVIVPGDRSSIVVHLSHNLVAPEWRRSGITGWMRALPLSTAMESLVELGRPNGTAITLVGEMEALEHSNPDTRLRLLSYEKAGFKMVDPARVGYLQPDFRHPVEIDQSSGPHPVPMCLIMRRVGREGESLITGAEVRHVVKALYLMYGKEFRDSDMELVVDSLTGYPGPEESIALLPPTLA